MPNIQCMDGSIKSVPEQVQNRFGQFDHVEGSKFGDTVVQLRYMMPNGENRVIRTSVAYQAQVQSTTIFEVVREGMENKARREVQDYIQQNAETGRGAVMTFNNPFYYDVNGTNAGLTIANPYYDQGTACTNVNCVPTQAYNPGDFMQGYVAGNNVANVWKTSLTELSMVVKLKFGNKTLCLTKKMVDDCIEITEEDIARAKNEYLDKARITIIARKADRKAEDLLKMFISEVDFRDFTEKGYFTVKSGDKAFRIYRDGHKWVDMYEKAKDRAIFVPKNRLCVHTERRVLPPADEALAKLMLIRSGQIIESANVHDIDANMEKELVLI